MVKPGERRRARAPSPCGRARGNTRLAVYGHSPDGPGRRGPYKWTPERIREELGEFLADRTDGPTADEFRAAGRGDLLMAVNRHGKSAYWAEQMGCTLSSIQDRSPYPQELARREASALIDQFGRLPNAVRLRELGYSRLAYLLETAGGARAFVRQHGLFE